MTGMAHPYIAERLAQEHRNDLLRSAECWRLAQMAEKLIRAMCRSGAASHDTNA
jgi:hypothetical protein